MLPPEGSGVCLYIELFQWNVINVNGGNACIISVWAAAVATVTCAKYCVRNHGISCTHKV